MANSDNFFPFYSAGVSYFEERDKWIEEQSKNKPKKTSLLDVLTAEDNSKSKTKKKSNKQQKKKNIKKKKRKN